MIDLNTKTITTLAGQVGVKGMDDGHPLDEATFSKPSGIWFVDDKDWFLITDNETDSLRLVHSEELIDLSGYCGDEPAFDNEEQAVITVTAVNPINHNLLPAIVLKTTDAIDTTTIDKENLRFTMNGNEVQAYTLEVVEDGQETQLIFKLGEDGKKGWTPGSSYKVKLCHQVLSDSGEPIEPVEIVVTTRPSNQQENIGITHSVNRSGVFYLPTGYDPEQDYPLALLLHGLGGKGHGMVSAFQTLADQMGVILLGPDGFAHDHPFNGGGSFYFNPNHINQEVEDFTFVVDCLEKLSSAFTIDESQVLVAGMSMGAPATLFFSGELDIFSHAAMLHGVRWNFDPNQENDVGNIPFFPWEQTPLGIYRPEFWYSTSVDDWVTNYDNIPIPGLTVEQDLAYIEGGDYNVTHKFDYPGGHTMSPQEKSDLFNWFLFGVAP